ncbi:concanavalin A-like lectin/glucanase domain-containing protein, partial [Cercophora newfieldiana]
GTNFFNGFEFNTADDISHGYVDYLSRTAASSAGLISSSSSGATIRVQKDKNLSNSVRGRKSVKIESTKRFDAGLFVARFDHFPKPVCGAWPAFSMYGPNWPLNGELDIYEQWNKATKNSITAHTSNLTGTCEIATPALGKYTGTVETTNCAVGLNPDQCGCSVKENSDRWGNDDGGTYAVQWTDEFIKVWSWSKFGTPWNVNSATPEPKEAPGLNSWGKPHFALYKSSCGIEQAFNEMRIAIGINFCGDSAGKNWDTKVDGKPSCKSSTGYSTCEKYVQALGGNYKTWDDVYFKIKDIKVYQN